MRSILISTILAAAVCTLTATAGTFTSDFSNPNQTGFTLNGGFRPDGVTPYPAIENGYLALTYNENSQQGTIAFDDLDGGAAIESFTATFKLQIGPGSGNAADGVAFSFGPDVTSASNFGEEGTGNGVIICFDTYNNGGNEAPAIDVKYGGNVIASTLFTKAEMVTGQFEDVSLQVTRSGALNLTWKGIQVYQNLILPDYAPSAGQFAIGGRTGGENAHQRIDDLNITTTQVGPTVQPSITAQPQTVTVAERGMATFSVGFDGSAPLTFKWFKQGVEIPGASGPALTLTRVPFADNGAKFKCEVSNTAGTALSQEATLTVNADTVAPTIVSVDGSQDFTHVTVVFSEPVTQTSAEKTSNYDIPGLTVSAAVLSPLPNDNKVLLTTTKQTAGMEYTLTLRDVTDTATTGNPIAAGASAKFTAYALVRGGLRLETFQDITGTAIDGLLTSDKYINNTPDFAAYVTEFSSRKLMPNNQDGLPTRENYGGRMSGWIVPPETAQYEFFIRSDDASQLYLSTNEDPANATTPIAEETGCCGPFEEPGAPETSAPVSLTAGQRYYIYAIWKEGGGGDYCDVAWRKVGDPAVPRALPYIQGNVLETYAQPTTFIPPQVAITSPADGATFETNAVVTMTATASAAAGKKITQVEFLELGRSLGVATASPYSIDLVNLGEGPHKIVARATDDAGISTDTAELVINIGKQFLELIFSQIDDKTTWRYDRTGRDLDTAWREKNFDDSQWPEGKMLIADETTTTVEPIRTAINRFNDAGEYVRTFYFRKKFNFDFLVNPLVKVQLRHVVDDGVIFYLNGKEIHRFGVTDDPVNFQSNAGGHENAYEGPYDIASSFLVEGENIFTAEVHQSGGSSSDMVFGAELKAIIPLVPEQLDVVKLDDKTTWRYDRSGLDLDTAWREKNFDDSQWPAGKALIADEATTTVEPIRTAISRFNDAGEYVRTFYYRTKFNLPIASTTGAKLKLRHVVDDGVIFYLNGKEIHRFGVTDDPVNFQSNAGGHENAWEGPYDIPITDLVPGENLLAAEVHQSGGSSSDMVFGAEFVAIVLVQQTKVTAEPKFTRVALEGLDLVLEYEGGTLQSATTVAGPYADVPGAGASSHRIANITAGGSGFFRIRGN
ncbi:MAG: Ig-like domain-containing protein [Verrucomicrobiota bacterium]